MKPQLQVRVTSDYKQAVKILAAQKGVTVTQLVTDALIRMYPELTKQTDPLQ